MKQERSSKSLVLLGFVATLLTAAPSIGQVTVSPSWPDDWVERREPIRLQLDREPSAAEGRLAVMIGSTDVTDLFSYRGNTLVYRADLLPLPSGENEIVVSLVDAQNNWREIARLPLRVLSRGGFTSSSFAPQLDVQTQTLIDEADSQPSGAGKGLDDWTGQLGLQGSLARRRWNLAGDVAIVGVTQAEQALRFATDGPDADRVDLSSWSARLERERGSLELGHISYGDSRHLINAMSSRGVAMRVGGSRWGEISAAAMNGNSIVGWNNFLGLANSGNQILSAGLGLELRPGRPGALRLDATWLDGSLLAESGFNQGAVTDKEESNGWSLRLRGMLPGDRIRFDAGYTESSFTNPDDAELAQGASLVAVRKETRSASYVDLDANLLQRTTEADRSVRIDLGARYQRVEPLFRSVATFVQADLEQTAVDLTGSFGLVNAQISASDSRDNLDDIPSILTTKTNRRAFSLSLPFAQMVSRPGGPRPWVPSLSYSFDRTRQYGEGIPVDGGFSASHIPDQVSLNQMLLLQWQGSRWTLSYTLTDTDQDNRQPGRERADFTTRTHGLTAALSAHRLLELTFDLSSESSDSKESGETRETTRYGFSFTSPLREWVALTGSASRSESEVTPTGAVDDATIWDLQTSFRVTRSHGERHGAGLSLFARYAWQDSHLNDPVFQFSQDLSYWSLNAGLNLSLY